MRDGLLVYLMQRIGCETEGEAAEMQPTSYRRWSRRVAANGLALLSFVLFAVAVLSLHQERFVPFVLEEEGPVSTVLSHYFFGATHALVDSAIPKFFHEEVGTLPAEEAIERALQAEIKPTHDLAPVTDGTGIGPVLMIRAAFAVFGLRARALPYFFVLVLGISTVAFIFRFQDRRIFVIPVLFTAFTVLILSPLTSDAANAAEAPFGGMRSYAIVGIIATLHWCFEIFDGSSVGNRSWTARWTSVSIQVTILGFAILVRGAPAYLLGPVLAVGLYRANMNWKWATLRPILLRVAVPIAALVVALLSITPIISPEYARAGRAFSTVWHRLFVTFGVHPNWPFPGLREKYSCPEIPEGLTPGLLDRAGHCIWWTYAREHHLSLERVKRETYGAEYERALRSAVWYVVRTYPKETIETFFIFKPKLVINNVLTMLNLHAPNDRSLPAVLLVLQCAILFVFMISWPRQTVLADIAFGARLLSLFLVFGLVPQIVAWARPPTVIDYNVYAVCVVILGFWLVLAAVIAVVVRSDIAPARSSEC